LAKLFRIYEHIARESRVAADETIARLYEAANHLERMPRLGRPTEMLDVRELVVPGTPNILRYRIHGKIPKVINIRHGKQAGF
jgi:plasmid stabilization system protein ParE